jgi:hypothetical protein
VRKVTVMIKVKLLSLPLLCLCLSALVACQGTSVGGMVETAIAPKTLPSDNLPQPIPTPSKTPSPLPSNPPNLDSFFNSLPKPSNESTIFPLRLFGITRALPDLLPTLNAQSQPNSQPTTQAKSQALTAFLPSDLESTPASLRPLVKDFSQLGLVAPKLQNNFEPNRPISRREYARWLTLTNNRIHQNLPSRQIRLAEPTSDTPIFGDVPRNDPDFSIIQGLANAGLIQVNVDVTNNATNLFRPEAQISREELLQWKVPLDLRRPLPNATVEAVIQTWGFQDSDRISPLALKAILADAQAGDLSNIRRSFGFTTLLQPQKPVTRAEAAAALWYFGTPSDGLSVQSVLAAEKSTLNPSSSNPSNPTPSPSPLTIPFPNSVFR